MSKKLSTADIKALFPVWLNRESEKENVLSVLENYDINNFSEIEEEFQVKNVKDADDLIAKVWATWLDPKNWNRIEKYKYWPKGKKYSNGDCLQIGSSSLQFALEIGRTVDDASPATFDIDMFGDCDQEYVNKVCKNIDLARECTVRIFEPKNAFFDSYRLLVLTSPDDTEVIGWKVSSD